MTRHQAGVTRHFPAFRALWVTALKAVLVVLALVLPQVLALALGLYHLSWFLGVQALASPLSSVIRRCVFLAQRLPTAPHVAYLQSRVLMQVAPLF